MLQRHGDVNSVQRYIRKVTQNYLYTILIEHVDEAIALQPRILEVLSSKVGRDTDYPDIYVVFSNSFRKFQDVSLSPRSLPFKFIINLLSYYPTIYSLNRESVVK